MSKKLKYLEEDKLDLTHPWRVTAPRFNIEVARLATETEARKYFDSVSDMGYQAILSLVIYGRIKIVDYTSPHTHRKD